MTTTNQAFIRVSRQDAAELAPAGPIIAHAGRHALAALHASVEIVAASGTTAAPARRAGARASDAALFATSIDVLPPKAEVPARAPLSSRARHPEKKHVQRSVGAPSRHFGQSNTPKKPLSSFIANGRAAQRRTPENRVHDLRPGTTVASFRWPGVCRALLQHSATQFDDLADALLPRAVSAPAVVGVLGLFRGDGCTTMASCLAARLAARNGQVILVDGNFTSPRLAQLLDAEPTIGWQESLANGTSVGDAIVRAVDDRLDLLALSADRTSDPRALLARPHATRLAAQLRSGYEVVLVDLGAFFDPRSQPVVLALVSQWKIQSVLAISGAEDADPRDLETLAEHLEQRGCALAGVAANRFAHD
jgi:Mrp family chromosome partitioning ATPase